jgi:RHH-type transcriptional regulator, rel operon repressor / antitoxin RelB
MTLTVRLGKKLEDHLRARLASDDETISEFVRKAVADRLERETPKKTPYELGKDVFGKFDSGRADLSTRSKEIFREKMKAKHAKRSR